jgi:transposase
MEALADKPRSGRPSKSEDAYSLLLEAVVEKAPTELGYNFAIWTIDRLRAHLAKETGIDLSDESRFRALLKRKGYRYRRPKHDLGHLQDKDAKAVAREQLEELKKKGTRRRFPARLYG